jgi:serine/threonine-protein kinase
MPDLIGMEYQEALEAYPWLRFNPLMEFSSDYPINTIILQDVEAGSQINRNTTVNVIVSMGEESIIMPDFSGVMQPEVEVNLESSGFKVVVEYEHSSDVPTGYFIRSDKQAGDKLEVGDTVTVFVSLGAEQSSLVTAVPDMVGLVESTARRLADEHRVSVTVRYEASTEEMRGRIIRQSMCLLKSSVTLSIC